MLRGIVALVIAAAAGLGPGHALAEGSRTLYPAGYNAAGYRADLDVSAPGTLYAGVVKRSGFLYVFAQAGDYITLGSRNRANGGDILVYNPQSFGAPGNETVPASANFSCANGSTQPGTHFSGGSLGLIATRAAELAGPNSANNAATVTNGFAPCAYQAPTTGIYGVRFTAATSGGSGASGNVATPGIGNVSISAWDVTVRADAASTTDLGARLFTYAFVGSTGANARPLYSTLYYVTQDGYRYRQALTGLDPNGFTLYANLLGFLDSGEPLYKDIRANSALISNFPPNVSAQPPQYPIFFNDITPGNANAASVSLVFQALGITENPPAAEVNGVGFVGNAGGNNSTVGAGGNFTFATRNTFTYQLVISRDGMNFDPANTQNRLLNGVALGGSHAVYWNGRDNSGANFAPGAYQFQLSGRNGEIHFPIIDAEGNVNGGPIVTGLNGSANSTVYFDDRGYITRSGTAVGTLNGFLCGAASPTPPTPDHSLTGVNSSVTTGGNYYRYWPGTGNANSDCSTSAAFGDAKGLDLWAAQSTVNFQQPLNVLAAPATPDVGTSATVMPTAFPGQTVYGSFVFRDDGNVNATGVTYGAVIGAPGGYPASVNFTLLPAGVTASYNAATGVVTLTGMPTTLTPGQTLTFNFNYPAPAPGTVPVTTTIAAANESPTPGVSPNMAMANTLIQIADLATTVSVPTAAPGGSVVDGSVTFANLSTATGSADNIVYSIVVGAAGSHPPTVTFPTLPPGVTATYDPDTGIVSLSGMPTSLAPGDTLTIGIEYTGPASGTVPVSASMTTPTQESTTANNAATGTTAFASADLAITKTDGVTTATPGGSVTYTIVASNAGPSDATGATVADTFPAALTATWTCVGAGGGTCTASGSGNINDTVNLPSGGSVTYTVAATISASATGTLSNTATVTAPAGVPDPTPGDNSATDTDTLTPNADLAITKTDGVTTATPGGSVTYTIVASNAGPSSATGATVADTFPASLTATWTCVGAGGGTCTASGSGNINDTVNLPSGGSVTYTVAATISASATGTLSNTATVTAPSGVTDPTPGNNAATDSDSLAPSADVAVSKTDGSASYTPGGSVVYIIIVTNNGPSNVTGEAISDPLPAGITTATWTCSASAGSTCAANGSGTITDTINLASGGTATYTSTLTVPANFSGDLSNTATATNPAGTTDPNPGNNSATDTDTQNAMADIALAKSVDNAAPNVGDSVTFTVTATNNGPSDATGVAATDGLPPGFTLLTATPSQGTYAPATGVWAIGALANGANATLTVTASVDVPGPLTNTVQVSASDQADPDTSNNAAGAAINANASADIRIAKTVDNATPNVGSNVVFTLTASNAGPNDATGVEVTDHLPVGLTLVAATPSQGSFDAGSGVWVVGALANGADATLTISASVDVPGSITNVATISHEDQFDPASGNNESGATVNGQQADIAVSKTVDETMPNVGANVTFTLSANNNGPNDATGVVVSDPLPAGLTFVSANPSQGSYNAATGAWTIGALSATGATSSATLSIVATVAASGPLANVATLTAIDQTDPNATNDTASAALNGNPQADLGISKSGPATVTPGDTIVYTIVVSNAGPSAATDVVVDDQTPTGLVFVGNSGACATAFPCSVGAIAAADSVTIMSTYTVPADYAGANPIVNTAAVSSTTPDPNTSNDQASANTGVGPGNADLGIVKDGPANADANGAVRYTLTISNAGPSPANGATYDDPLPAGLTAISARCGGESGGATCGTQPVVAGNDVSGQIGALPSGGSVVVTIDATAPAGPVTLTNNATITAPAGVTDGNGSNDQSSVDTAIGAPSADLAIVKTGPASATPGQNVSFTLELTNNGPGDASAIVITDATPAGLTFVSASAPCQGGFPCAYGDLAAGANAILTVTYAIPADYAGGAIVNVASLSSPTADPDGNNNVGTVSVPVASADLTIVKTGPSNVAPGAPITYSLRITNLGPAAADGATYDDPVPAEITAVAASCGDETGGAVCAAPVVSGNDVSGAIPTLPMNGAVTITINGTAPATETLLNNTATVTPPGGLTDPTPDNNSSTVGTTTPVTLLEFGVD